MLLHGDGARLTFIKNVCNGVIRRNRDMPIRADGPIWTYVDDKFEGSRDRTLQLTCRSSKIMVMISWIGAVQTWDHLELSHATWFARMSTYRMKPLSAVVNPGDVAAQVGHEFAVAVTGVW